MLAAWLVAGMPTLTITTNSILGAVAAFIGVIFCLLSVAQFRFARTTVDPRTPDKSRQIVSTGMYAHSRNPMYLGFAFILAGWVIALGNIWAGLALPAFTEYITRFQIVPEELILRTRFGRDYDLYAARVRRWI